MLRRKQTRAIQKFIYSVFKQFWQLSRSAGRQLSRWLVRNLVQKSPRRRRYAYAKSGFVLPTVVLMLLVVTLVIGGILLRTTSRTNQVIGAREEQVIYNAATPAIERAKAKLEFLFQQDSRRPTGAASDQMLLSLLVNDESLYPGLTTRLLSNGRDPYTFPGERSPSELNIRDRDGKLVPAWSYQIDVDNDQRDETVVYGIYLRSRSDDREISIDGIGGRDEFGNAIDRNGPDSDRNKSLAQVTRNGPINTTNLNDSVCASITQPNTAPAAGQILPVDESVWYPVGSGILRKTFQIDAIVISNNQGTSRTVATLEFQQDRQLDRANRWGAWFRYDMEIYPGAPFNWNGAMYSAGNMFIGSNNQFRAYLISARQSCFYGKDSSEITVLEEPRQGGFQGQVVAKQVRNEQAGSAGFDLQDQGGNDSPPEFDGTNPRVLNGDNDSAKNDKNARELALDPVILFTQDKSSSINVGPQIPNDPPLKSNRDARIASWETAIFKQRGRIRNNQQNPPYVDDTYRADNRYGPKPKYDQVDPRYALDNGSKKNGQFIPTTETKLINNTTNAVSDPEFRNLGLDGYWERRAWANGLRILVSPRLELGNTFGWVNSDLNRDGNRIDDSREVDPLYPVARDDQNTGTISHEKQQRRTFRDNLAAVQATAVYHHEVGSGSFPIAFMATTVHPGTERTEQNSRSFNRVLPTNPRPIYSNFFTGEGTNGWEYEVVPGDGNDNEASFANLINDSNSPLRKVLENLANFAGDPQGAFPPVQESGGSQVHPDSEMAMWGNFSNLRRVINLLRSGANYGNLSIADKSYLHTAAGTLGMLAYNLTYDVTDTASASDKESLGQALWERMKVTTGITQVLDTSTTTIPRPTPSGTPSRYALADLETYRNTLSTAILNQSPNNYLRGLTTGSGAIAESDIKVRLANIIHTTVQAQRDRRNGFFSPTVARILATSDTSTTPFVNFNYRVQFTNTTDSNDPLNPLAADNPLNTGITPPALKLPCNPADFGYFGITANPTALPASIAEERQVIALAASLCSINPKYPALYYTFPLQDHQHSNAVVDMDGDGTSDQQPTTEPYIADTYIANTANNAITYRAITSADIANQVALRPKNDNTFASGCGERNWCLPTTNSGDPDLGIFTPSAGWNTTSPGNIPTFNRYVSLIDSAFLDSREKMTVRALNIDMNLLRRNTVANNNTWLPRSGIVYAFREDAVREDAIARPASGDRNDNTNPGTPKDPALSTINGISPKAVDFYPDPDRRPYGFRLRNGQDLRRFPGGGVDDNNPRGITLVSDNPVYIQGNFNFHSTDGNSNNLEEFRDPLTINVDNSTGAVSWPNFYTRGTNGLEPRFARVGSGNDTWRPAEILSDAISILSNSFAEGYIDLAITNDAPNTSVIPNGRYSFRAMNGPNSTPPNNRRWVLENGTTRIRVGEAPPANYNPLPIKISRNGNPIYCEIGTDPGVGAICPPGNQTEYTTGYWPFSQDFRDRINQASETRVNAIIVSGIVPTRQNQQNGGFHNFPRYIENWNGTNSFISGSFVQLNFSTYATAPYNHILWEPDSTITGNNIQYYQPPNRSWGYDVGLQYAPAGPLSQRFVTSGVPRSEFYRDLKVDDPYICRLRLALNRLDNRIDPASQRECNN